MTALKAARQVYRDACVPSWRWWIWPWEHAVVEEIARRQIHPPIADIGGAKPPPPPPRDSDPGRWTR